MSNEYWYTYPEFELPMGHPYLAMQQARQEEDELPYFSNHQDPIGMPYYPPYAFNQNHGYRTKNFLATIENTKKVLNIIQVAGPLILKFSPILNNLPELLSLLNELQKMDDDPAAS